MIDRGLPPEGWPPQIQQAVAHFHQGHIIDFVPCAYATNFDAPIWTASRQEVRADGTGDFTVIRSGWPNCIILSQTCDVCEEGKPRLKFPWITVAPVYDIFPDVDRGQRIQIARGDFRYLVPLTAADLRGDGLLIVADLRLEYPVEKGRLIGQASRSGFATMADVLAFGRRLADRRNRPAIDATIYEHVLLPLHDQLKSGAIASDQIDEVRIRVGPSFERVEYIILFIVISDRAQRTGLQKQMDEFLVEANAALADGPSLIDIKVGRAVDFTYGEMQSTMKVDYDDLSPG